MEAFAPSVVGVTWERARIRWLEATIVVPASASSVVWVAIVVAAATTASAATAIAIVAVVVVITVRMTVSVVVVPVIGRNVRVVHRQTFHIRGDFVEAGVGDGEACLCERFLPVTRHSAKEDAAHIAFLDDGGWIGRAGKHWEEVVVLAEVFKEELWRQRSGLTHIA